jgi:hypothetical protein
LIWFSILRRISIYSHWYCKYSNICYQNIQYSVSNMSNCIR